MKFHVLVNLKIICLDHWNNSAAMAPNSIKLGVNNLCCVINGISTLLHSMPVLCMSNFGINMIFFQ